MTKVLSWRTDEHWHLKRQPTSLSLEAVPNVLAVTAQGDVISQPATGISCGRRVLHWMREYKSLDDLWTVNSGNEWGICSTAKMRGTTDLTDVRLELSLSPPHLAPRSLARAREEH